MGLSHELLHGNTGVQGTEDVQDTQGFKVLKTCKAHRCGRIDAPFKDRLKVSGWRQNILPIQEAFPLRSAR